MAKPKGAEDSSPPVEVMVWVLFLVAAAATVFSLLREQEDRPGIEPMRPAAHVQMLGVAAPAVGAAIGVWRILSRRGPARENLFAMAVLFNLVLLSYWVLQLALSAPRGPDL